MAKTKVKKMTDETPQVAGGQEVAVEKEARVKVEKVRGKKYKEVKAKIDNAKGYKLNEAIAFLKGASSTKFDETLELHIVVKKTGLTTNVVLPHSGGKEKKIEVADEGTIKKLESGKVDFDVLLATAEMMPKLVKFARILGPKGMMPNPKNGTLIKSASEAKNFSGNTKTIKTEKEAPLIHTSFGKLSQSEKELVENASTILEAIDKKKIVKAFMKSTMSPAVKIQI